MPVKPLSELLDVKLVADRRALASWTASSRPGEPGCAGAGRRLLESTGYGIYAAAGQANLDSSEGQ